ncbi:MULTISPECIES: GntR family transcriptional regulator [Citricoccus]|uniref:GntR family transcriptional regulator n=1 Tax=Citricoccus TaxID=169133 RepID=UPI000255EE2C|nr:GntR family transcriptional regulator [Citricoccus sp. CH26A]
MAPQIDEGFDAPPTLGEAVSRRLRDEILSGRLAPGAPIRDAELASRLGVSITPVRESVAVLISEGLIEVLPNKRRRVTVLTQQTAQELMDVLGILLAAGFERLPGNPEKLEGLADACREFAETLGAGDRSTAEAKFERMVAELLRQVAHGELSRMAAPVLRRSVGAIRLYPSAHLYELWGQAFLDVADALTEDPARASSIVRTFVGALLATMAGDRPQDAEIRPEPRGAGLAPEAAGEVRS